MDKNKHNRREIISDILLVAGGIAVSVGISLLHVAAGIIAGGALTIVYGWLIGRVGEES